MSRPFVVTKRYVKSAPERAITLNRLPAWHVHATCEFFFFLQLQPITHARGGIFIIYT